MAADVKQIRRVTLALMEHSPLDALWRALVDHLADAPAEVIALFVSDDRWHRVASLPFTREISRFSGTEQDFTRQRAEQLRRDAVGRAREHVRRLAAEARLDVVFEVLPEHEAGEVGKLVHIRQDLLVAPAILEGRPVFAELARLNRRVVLIDTKE